MRQKQVRRSAAVGPRVAMPDDGGTDSAVMDVVESVSGSVDAPSDMHLDVVAARANVGSSSGVASREAALRVCGEKSSACGVKPVNAVGW